MLHDKLDDPDAAPSFSGVLLRPEHVAERIAGLLDRPRAVLTIPRWRGGFVRAFDAFPGAPSGCCRCGCAMPSAASGAGSGGSTPASYLSRSGSRARERRPPRPDDHRAREPTPAASRKAAVVPGPSTITPPIPVPAARPTW